MVSYIGYNAEKSGAKALLKGRLPPDTIIAQLLPETQQIVRYTANFSPPQHSQLDTAITTDKFSSLYKVLDERTSSSPSGQNLGHYKAAVKSDILTQVYTHMMTIPHLAGFSQRRWRQVVDVMLEKKQGGSRVHSLCIVALQESDFNQSNHLAIGKQLLEYLEDHNLLPPMQHGSRPAKLCLSAVLNKVLGFKIL